MTPGLFPLLEHEEGSLGRKVDFGAKATRSALVLGPLLNLCAFADAATVHCSRSSAVQLRGQCVAIHVRVFS